MRVLFTRFPLESRYGGAEVQTITLMKGLQEAGHEVSFLGSCPTLLRESAERRVKSEELIIGPPPVTKWHATSFAWRRFGMKKKLIEALATFLERAERVERPLHSPLRGSVEESCAVFMLSLSEKLLLTDFLHAKGVRVFWVEHDRVSRWITHNPWLPRLRKLSRLVTTVVVSGLSKEIYVKELGFPEERVVSIPNGVDLHRFQPSPSPNPNPTVLRVGCVARLTKDKGTDLLIDAVSDLSNIELTIVGTGKEEKNLRKLASEKLKTINYKLVTSVSDLPDFYRSQDVIILPSREHDPFGLVIAEAMACGVPTVVTDACGITRHLQPGESMIVEAGNMYALREALRDLQNSNLRLSLSKNGINAAHDRFSTEKMVESYLALLSRS